MNTSILKLSDSDRERMEQFLVEFDQYWTPDHLGIVAGQLQAEAPDFKAAALIELVKIDLDYRHQQAPTGIEWYLEQFPELGESVATLSDLLHAELTVRRAAGDTPSPAELQQRFPALHEQVETLLAKVAEQDEFSALRRAKRSDSGGKSSGSTTSIATAAQETLWPDQRPRHAAHDGDAVPPEQFGRYRLLRELGHGAMGTVYLAEDTELRRRVALKRPRVAGTDDASLLERFYREAYAAATLDHPNICPVYDVGHHEGVPYITMAYVEGKTLSRVIRESRALNPRAVAALLRKIAVAVAEAHAKGVIHRDLKPSNIMLNHRNDPIVMDFGLARQVQDVKDRLTVDGTLIGTPGYMSPEQVDGDLHTVGPASDIYSVGVVLFELLTGKLPFQGSVTAVIGKILRDEPPTPSSLRAGVPQPLEDICMKMMAKAPANRYATMGEVAEALGAYIKSSGEGATAVEPPPIESLTPAQLAEQQQHLDQVVKLQKEVDEPQLRKWLAMAAAAFLISFGLISWAVILYLRHGDQEIAVEIDPAWLNEQNGQLTLTVDGLEHAISGPGFDVKVALGAHGFSVKNGDTVVHDPQTFTIEKEGRKVLRIDRSGINLGTGNQIGWAVPTKDPSPNIQADGGQSPPYEISPRTSLPEGLPGLAQEFKGHSAQIVALAISPDGKTTASASTDMTLRLWDTASGRELLVVDSTASQWVKAMRFTPDGRFLAIAKTYSAPPKVQLLEVATGNVVRSFDASNGTPLNVAIDLDVSEDGQLIAAADSFEGKDQVYLWETQTGRSLGIIDLAGTIRGVRFIEHGKSLIVSTSKPGYGTRAFDLASLTETAALPEAVATHITTATVPESSLFAVSDTSTLRVCDVAAKIVLTRLTTNQAGESLAFLPGGKHVAIANGNSFEIRNTADGQRSYNLDAETRRFQLVAISEDGRFATTGGGGIWNSAKNRFDGDGDYSVYLWRLPKEVWPTLQPDDVPGGIPPPSAPRIGETWQSRSPRMDFVWCPPGKFRMGSGETPLPNANETPVDVTLTQGLWAGKQEITQSQWKAVMGTEPWKSFQDHREGASNAASHVTWIESVEFCRKLTEIERKAGTIPVDREFRLPTEAEWEYFARAGTTTRFSFGDDHTALSEHAWWRGNAEAKGENYAHEVGTLKPNPWGLHDIHGNVYEWCQDTYTGRLPGGTDPLVVEPGHVNRVNRGGGWDFRDELAHTSSNRRSTPEYERRNNLGLRVVISQVSTPDTSSQPSSHSPDSS